ncbi:hypothetical protein F5X68DRAFT_23027 [Plectosphaerella plurivora]|uniref:Uncharacterized protein n=1 Tax=Plectosphaerella plurivora TaxID=936078 RepID=A0A9P8V9Q9_9PEZI|nr:hypothetical protein F5X68DRAFT_23027 [Plectosphaerella plurivora]
MVMTTTLNTSLIQLAIANGQACFDNPLLAVSIPRDPSRRCCAHTHANATPGPAVRDASCRTPADTAATAPSCLAVFAPWTVVERASWLGRQLGHCTEHGTSLHCYRQPACKGLSDRQNDGGFSRCTRCLCISSPITQAQSCDLVHRRCTIDALQCSASAFTNDIMPCLGSAEARATTRLSPLQRCRPTHNHCHPASAATRAPREHVRPLKVPSHLLCLKESTPRAFRHGTFTSAPTAPRQCNV